MPFDLEQVDITEDPKLAKKYKGAVPVVTIDGTEAFRSRVPKEAFKRQLERRVAEIEEAAQKSPEKESSSVPMPAKVALMAAVVAGAGFFITDGFAEVGYGRGRLARTLLKVEARNEAPLGFKLERMSGDLVSSDERFRDKVVFINFWATWCPPCVEEMPSMLRLRDKMSDEPRFQMLAISTDNEWAPVRKFFERPPGFDVLLDQEGKLARQYGTEKFPETYVVVDGRLVGYIIGPRDWDTWYAEAYLRELTKHGLEL